MARTAGVLWNSVYAVAAVTAPNLSIKTSTMGDCRSNGIRMPSQRPEHTMHAKEIGLHVVCLSHPPKFQIIRKLKRTAPIVGDMTTKN